MTRFRSRSQAYRRLSRTGQARRGFALIIALTLMSFLLLLLLTMGVLAQTEMHSLEHQMSVLRAREMARFGLIQAVGELQKATADDRYIVASGAFDSGSTWEKRHWLGVWDNTGSRTGDWLVSHQAGNTPDITTDPPVNSSGNSTDSDFIVLAGGHSVDTGRDVGANGSTANGIPDDVVVAEKVPVIQNANTVGNYAWWVSDESSKTCLPVKNRVSEINGLSPTQKNMINQSMGQMPGVDSILDDPSDMNTPDIADIHRIIDSNQIQFIQYVDTDVAARHFHDFTAGKRGVLIDTINGGLRKNIQTLVDTDPGNNAAFFSSAPYTSDIFTNGVFDDYLNTAKNTLSQTIPGYDPAMQPSFTTGGAGLPGMGKPLHTGTPVITEFIIRWAVFSRKASGTLFKPSLRFYVDIELYNPWPWPIQLSNNNDLRAYTVMVEGMPEIRFRNTTRGYTTTWFKIDDIYQSSGSDRETSSWLEIDVTAGGNRTGIPILNPGEVYRLADPDPTNQPQGLWKGNNINQDIGLRASDPGGPGNVGTNDTIVVELRPPNNDSSLAKYSVRLIEGHSAGRDDTHPIAEVRNIPYTNSTVTYQFASAGTSSPAYIQGDGYSSDIDVSDTYIFAYHFRMQGSSVNVDAQNVEWLGSADVRNPSIDYDGTYYSADGTMKNYSDIIDIAAENPININSNLSSVFSNLDLFADPQPRNQVAGLYQDLRYTDIPTREPVVISDLRHAQLFKCPPLALGSGKGGGIPRSVPGSNINQAFDLYFLSTVPANTSQWNPSMDTPLQNTQLVYTPQAGSSPNNTDLRDYDAAQHFMIRDPLNVNSLSVDAWRALLSQETTGWFYLDTNGNPQMNNTLANAFFRFPFAAFYKTPFHLDDEIAGMNLSQKRNLWKQNFRSMNTPDANDQIGQLASRLVDYIRENGPFHSISEFLNTRIPATGEPILQQAIDDVGPAYKDFATTTPINDGIIPYAPTFISDGEVFARISPYLTAHADTFTIRSYGDISHPLTGETQSRAYLEARIQRLTEKSDGSNAIDPSDSVLNARRLQIVSIKWLNTGDI